MIKKASKIASIALGGMTFFMLLLLLMAWPAGAQEDPSPRIYLPIMRAPIVALDAYETEFADSIDPWQAVRWQKGINFDVTHEDGCDSGHCGFLDVDVDNAESYTIVSPLIQGPGIPYDIEFRAKLRDREDKHQYGVVFGADRSLDPCPGDNTDACFNRYYEFRVRYRDENGQQFLEYRLRRVDGHDNNNVEQGEDLLPWTRAEGIPADDWVKWEVRYGTRGDITFKANNQELPGSVNDRRHDDPLYFGVFARAGDNGDVRARFDKFSLVASP